MARILIVDDVPDNLQLLRLDLEDDGHDVIVAASGLECIAQVDKTRPEAVLLDLRMPGIDGKETLRRLKATPEGQSIPVIMLTANDVEEDVVTCIDLGAHDYVTKPYVYPILSARLRSALRIVEQQRQLLQANARLLEMATTDALTGVHNRRHFLELANAELMKGQRSRKPVSVMMLDVDHFKRINDTFGHAVGDRALSSIAALCAGELRKSDIVGRLGGEEFAVCCPDASLDGARVIGERIRRAIEGAVMHEGDRAIAMTASVGVAIVVDADSTIEQALGRADALLYRAKADGRNRVVCE